MPDVQHDVRVLLGSKEPAAQQALRLASSHGFGRKDFSSVYMFLRASSREAPV